MDIGAFLGFETATELTLDSNTSGTITPTQSNHLVDTFNDQSTGDLATLATTNVSVGDTVRLAAANSARTVVIKHGTGNIQLGGAEDFSLDETWKVVELQWNGTNWMGGPIGAGGSGGDFVTITTASETIHVNGDSGSDSTGDGSSGSPYATIQKAVDELPDLIAHATTISVEGDTLPITYSEQVDLKNKAGTTPTAKIVIEGDPTTPANIVVDGGSTRTNCIAIANSPCPITLDGFKAQNGTDNNVDIRNCADVTFRNLISTGAGNTGIFIENSTLREGDNVDCNNNSFRGIALTASSYWENESIQGFNASNNTNRGLSVASSYVNIRGNDQTDNTDIQINNNGSDGVLSTGAFRCQIFYAQIGGNASSGVWCTNMSYGDIRNCDNGSAGANTDFAIEASRNSFIVLQSNSFSLTNDDDASSTLSQI